MPRTTVRVVCGLSEVITTLLPTSALVSVDLPAFGRPTNETNPLRCSVGCSLMISLASSYSAQICSSDLPAALPARQIGPGSTARGWRCATPRQ